jgi:hypothetical protein
VAEDYALGWIYTEQQLADIYAAYCLAFGEANQEQIEIGQVPPRLNIRRRKA